MAESIPLAVPHLGGNERDYLDECLTTNFVSTAGPFVSRFEQDLATNLGAGHCVATSTGTAALHIALLVAGAEPNDEVIVPSLTFISPVNAIRYAEAWPVFVDSEPDYWQIDPDRVREFLESSCSFDGERVINKRTGRRIRALLPVHLLGHPCDLPAIRRLADEFSLTVVEDAAESLGARCHDTQLGADSHLNCFSFNGNKIVTAGAGGAVVTSDPSLAARAKHLSTTARLGADYVHDEVGYNYRMTNLHAAVGCAQLEQLDGFVAKKRAIAQRYAEALRDIPGLSLMKEAPWAFSTFWLYTVLVEEDRFGMSSRELRHRLVDSGVSCRNIWQPNHLSLAHSRGRPQALPVAETVYRDALSLPSSVGMTDSDQNRVIEVVRQVSGESG